MIKNKTVVVVGAGASFDLGFPLGTKLKDDVADLLARDRRRRSNRFKDVARYYFRESAGSTNILEEAAVYSDAIRTSLSIDNFLDQHKDQTDLVMLGKMAIVWGIALAEQRSRLKYVHGHTDGAVVNAADNYFLLNLLQIAAKGHQRENISESLKNLTFVVFNYDRCVERFLHAWLQVNFGLSLFADEPRPKIIHVYGSLGEYSLYEGQQFEARGDGKPYLNPQFKLHRIAEKIKIFTEQEDSETASLIKAACNDARSILFFGFGFEEQNMRFFDGLEGSRQVFATMHSLGEPNREYLVQLLSEVFCNHNKNVRSLPGTGPEMIEEFRYELGVALGSI